MTARPPWIVAPGPVAAGLRIGLLGGSFDPAHDGHLYISRIALKALKLDYVWWLVSPGNPLKPMPDSLPVRLTRARNVARDRRVHGRFAGGAAEAFYAGRFRLADGQ